jgi:thiamine-monophosphate kinase
VGARICLAKLPLSRSVREHFRSAVQAAAFAARGGEDYELLLAVPPGRSRPFERACRRASHPITQVGRLTTSPQICLELPGGELLPAPAGYDHFAGRRARGAI